jgi:UDP-N-acetylmuramyl pentapeptide phosphotransferase/UDP-N-acetylglucosamine-1-phosphate transferase
MLFLILLIASLIVSFLTVVQIKQRFSQHLLDIPNDRSSHTQPTPRGGGLGFIVAFAVTSALAKLSKSWELLR